jgi:hypothetical protein
MLARKRSADAQFVPLNVADMRNLGEVPTAGFHVVIYMDNALPQFLNEADLAQAAQQSEHTGRHWRRGRRIVDAPWVLCAEAFW